MKHEINLKSREIAFVLAFFLVFFGGYLTGRESSSPLTSSLPPGTVINSDKSQPNTVDFGLFWEAWNVVNDKYVKEPNDQERVYGAIEGMVAGLGDPFSAFMKPSETARFNEEISGNFDGIGAELVGRDGAIIVARPLENTPADRAGIKAGDIITKIDGEPAPSVLEEAVKLIRGPKGTQVTLTIVRDGEEKEFKVTRDKLEIQSVTYKLTGSTAVIGINQFNANTPKLLDEILAKAKREGATSLILDLRNNPGGLLNEAVDITSRFIDSGVVVIQRDRQGNETALNTTPVGEHVTLPMVVLVNNFSASASEIFAGAMQDHNRAKVVGETTFGKGSVQAIEELSDGSAVRVTIAEWLTPNKREINKHGVKPDVEVKRTEDDIKNSRDPQLDKALELLK